MKIYKSNSKDTGYKESNHIVTKSNINVDINLLSVHPLYSNFYSTSSLEYLEESIERSGSTPVYPVVCVKDTDDEGHYRIVSGNSRYLIQLNSGQENSDIILYDGIENDESAIKTLIVDLNKQRSKSGRELLMEFRHYCESYPVNRGKRGYNRYQSIGREIGYTPEKTKSLIILNDFFSGKGEVVLESIFDPKGMNISNAEKLKAVVNKYPEKFNNPEIYSKLTNRVYCYDRLDYVVSKLNLDDDFEFNLGEKYLLKEYSTVEFEKLLVRYGKAQEEVENHTNSKSFAPILDDNYKTENLYIVKGDNRTVSLECVFPKKVRCIAGSPPYGNKRNDLSGLPKGYTGEQYADYLVKTYQRWLSVLAEDGSIYVNTDDFQINDSLACSIEHFVIGMKNIGLHLVERIVWIKNNPIPNSYSNPKMVNGFEMIYRFVKNPKNYFTNPLYLENGEPDDSKFALQKGCSNPKKDGSVSQGAEYVQSQLKKVRNTLDEISCQDIIRGNVANPERYFMQAGDKNHNSTFPINLISTLILQGSEEGDLIADIWNGQGNTMEGALLLGRKYWGVEIDENYYEQSCHRADILEGYLLDDDNYSIAA